MMVSGLVVKLTLGGDVNSKDLLKSRLARKCQILEVGACSLYNLRPRAVSATRQPAPL